ncbi:unnamed protein product [Cyprideis torosa]|uniref:Uncharacterized protein n=1 Tax=Cyprideis torosa TaxID=163714 RepID=A0A7R8WNE7_9CRUS|nr:unnamed protein product [Cyprideis torosa]CAG0900541.1 unnamed protein product [Cyprideis torosa]
MKLVLICALLPVLVQGKSIQQPNPNPELAEPYDGQCDDPFLPTRYGHCYWPSFRALRANWYDAQTRCRLLHPRAHLAQFEDSEELLAAVFFLNSMSNCSAWAEVGPWIGAIEVEGSNAFVWGTTNSPLETSYWHSDEPNSPGEQDAVALTCADSFKWQDLEKEAELAFLCELAANPPSIKLTCPEGFLLIGESCYAFGDETQLNWDDSQTYCRSLVAGGRLTEFETEREFHLVTDFLRENKTTSYYWIGAEQRGDSLHYQWSSTTWPLTFYNWYNTQPDNSGSGNAIYIQRNFDWQWMDGPKESSSYLRFQLCETTPLEAEASK